MTGAPAAQKRMLVFTGHNHYRQRLILATLAGKAVRIQGIRPDDDDNPGLADYEASFLRLIEKVTNGCTIEISYTGTSVTYHPGTLIGGRIDHDCPSSRAIGYFLEPMLALAPFCKFPLELTLNGITNDNVDISADLIRTLLLPQLGRFGVEGDTELKITRRGAPPLGGGQVTFRCPIVRQLKPTHFVDVGHIKRIRGIAYATRMSPQMANRVAETARGILTRFIPDVYVYTDVYKGIESGKSPGYALSLVAESTTGSLVAAECAYQPRKRHLEVVHHAPMATTSQEEAFAHANKDDDAAGALGNTASAESTTDASTAFINDYAFPTPEDLGVRAARLLLHEVRRSGCVDSHSQWLHLLFMALGPEDVSKVRLGSLTPFSVQYLRDLFSFLNVTFKVTPDTETHTVLLSSVGVGFTNINKKAT